MIGKTVIDGFDASVLVGCRAVRTVTQPTQEPLSTLTNSLARIPAVLPSIYEAPDESNADRFYILVLQPNETNEGWLVGYVLQDPAKGPVRWQTLLPFNEACYQHKRRHVDMERTHRTPTGSNPSLKVATRQDPIQKDGVCMGSGSDPKEGVGVGGWIGSSPKHTNYRNGTRIHDSLALLEVEFHRCPKKQKFLRDMVPPDADLTPSGLLLMGDPEFGGLFRSYRTLFEDRCAAFGFASKRVLRELSSYDAERIQALEQEALKVWQTIHECLLKRLT